MDLQLVLAGELVRLRPLEQRDADNLFEAVVDPETRRLTGTTQSFTKEGIVDWIAHVNAAPDRFDFAMTSLMPDADGTVSDELIGEIVLNDYDPVLRCANVRLQSLAGFRGRGYGGEAMALVMKFGFTPAPLGLGLHRLELDVLSINPRAKMLYENLGFVQEGVARDAALDGEAYCDVITMSILADEYADLNPGFADAVADQQ